MRIPVSPIQRCCNSRVGEKPQARASVKSAHSQHCSHAGIYQHESSTVIAPWEPVQHDQHQERSNRQVSQIFPCPCVASPTPKLEQLPLVNCLEARTPPSLNVDPTHLMNGALTLKLLVPFGHDEWFSNKDILENVSKCSFYQELARIPTLCSVSVQCSIHAKILSWGRQSLNLSRLTRKVETSQGIYNL